MAQPGPSASASGRSAHRRIADLRARMLVHRRLRHAGPERRQGSVGRIGLNLSPIWLRVRESGFSTTATFAGHSTYVRNAAKARAQVRAALGRYPLIGDRPGQCLVSDGFETRIGRADRAKPIQAKKFAIHTLGHLCAFAAARNWVWLPAVNRHSRSKVGNAPVGRPTRRAR